jgi:LuxR family maltose regulon positive regulatory protein
VRQAQGLRAEAKDLMLRAQTDAHELQDQALVDYVTILSADLTIAYDETLTVQWTHDLAPVLEDRASEATLLLYKHKILALALAWLANQKPAQAEMLLGQLVPVLRTAGHIASLIEALALQALAWQAQGQSDQALTALQEALALAEPEGYVRTFVDRGELMARLLRQAFERQIASAYVDPLLAAFDTSRFEPVDMGPLAGARPGQKAASVESGAPMIERLNEQEFKILGLVAAGLSNREIARELFLSVNTVKWYLKEIYGKLDAHGRVEAISRARELGLL